MGRSRYLDLKVRTIVNCSRKENMLEESIHCPSSRYSRRFLQNKKDLEQGHAKYYYYILHMRNAICFGHNLIRANFIFQQYTEPKHSFTAGNYLERKQPAGILCLIE